jgi:hypothetical protein
MAVNVQVVQRHQRQSPAADKLEAADSNGRELRSMDQRYILALACAVLPGVVWAQDGGAAVGVFEGHADVGTVLHPGAAQYDAARRSYTVSGSGENMWFVSDAFQFVWKKVSGDVTIAADIAFPSPGGNAHRKAVLMVRQSLDADSVYADVARHGEGLTSIQFREEKGGTTHEVQSNISAPQRLRLVKQGNYAYMLLAGEGDEPRMAAGSPRIELRDPYYVGIGVCAHDKDAMEQAVFTNLELTSEAPKASRQPVLSSTLETIPVPGGDRRVVYATEGRIEAPNWTRDGAAIVYNSQGHLYRIPASGGRPEAIETGPATRINNDHGISPDGTMLAISDQTQDNHQSIIYVLPLAGGTPRRVTAKAPSYFHGWSPDGKTLAFCGQRDGEFDIYTIPAEGGEETRLTTAPGLDDGPEYSPGGEYIYFNSERTGTMQIWRMKPDGTDQKQVTNDEYNNWFAHPSPDGKQLVFLSYEKDVKGHPENKDVMLRLITLADGKITVLARLFGGQGTINTPSWSPDGRRLAFVSYQLQ